VCCSNQPCWRCVRLGRADTCQPPQSRKRGRPRKVLVVAGPTTTTTTTTATATTTGGFEERALTAALNHGDDAPHAELLDPHISASSPTNEQSLPTAKRARLPCTSPVPRSPRPLCHRYRNAVGVLTATLLFGYLACSG
jgi:hypothetical protein